MDVALSPRAVELLPTLRRFMDGLVQPVAAPPHPGDLDALAEAG